MKQTSKKANKANKIDKAGASSIAYRVLIEPIITEAATIAIELNKYSFKVAVDATKIQIKSAIEELYKVKVISVNTLNNRRRAVSYGRTPGFKAGSKKAIVTLKAGDSIELFKGV
ncbi:MAG: 50S ribosomal protein L23 [Parcubacteria group bacterium]